MASASPPQPHILLVDDEATIRFALREYFTSQGSLVACASTLVEARDLLARNRFDVAVLDLRLEPGVTDGGLSLASHIKQAYPQTRIIILTAFGTKELRAKALALGVDEFLSKPTRLWDLCETIRALAGGSLT